MKRRPLKKSYSFLLLFFFLLFFVLFLYWRPPMQKETKVPKEEFITTIVPMAQQSMKKYHIPASIIIAQAALESNFGQSELAEKYNNLFGVKAGFWEPGVDLPTIEYVDGQRMEVEQRFRVYRSWKQSILAHAKLLAHGTSWNEQQYEEVLQAKNYQAAAYALQNAGYATDPNYAQKLIQMIETYQLYRWDE